MIHMELVHYLKLANKSFFSARLTARVSMSSDVEIILRLYSISCCSVVMSV